MTQCLSEGEMDVEYIYLFKLLFSLRDRYFFFIRLIETTMESLRRSFNTLLSLAVEDPVSLLIPVIVGSIFSSFSIYSYQLFARIRIRQEMRKGIKSGLGLSKSPESVNSAPVKPKLKLRDDKLGAELIREQLSRNFSFFGEEAMADIQSAFVIVVGCGGVGSHAAHMLVRSGITRLRIIGSIVFSNLYRFRSSLSFFIE
jgi:hypothetical protein